MDQTRGEVQSEASQIAEYQATQASYLHYDSFRWQAGSLLILAVFFFWSQLINPDRTLSGKPIGQSCLLIAALMTVWILFAHHYRQIYLYKLHRIHELEESLHMQQHRRFKREKQKSSMYRVFGPRGHNLDLAIYTLTSLGGPFLAYLRTGFDYWLLSPALVVVVISIWIIVNEHRIIAALYENGIVKVQHNAEVKN